MEWFRKRGGRLSRPIELEEVISFSLYDARGCARLGEAVEVRKLSGAWELVESGCLVARVDDLEPPPRKRRAPLVPPTFDPPLFGITVLGSSHGFDPGGKTTGFLLWINRKGILVDPPPDTTEILRAAGIRARQVDSLILTHCHADHDAGVFRKLLEEQRVQLLTTPTILGSFLRKYVALTEESEEQLRRLFVFRQVVLGETQRIHGAAFRFFYTLHSIPTIGFECSFGDKSFVYSSDTLYDPPEIQRMQREGVLSEARRDALIDFPWHHSLVLHEAGVPPIHTPAARLAELSPDIKERLWLIHTAEADLPPDRGLRVARTGFENTLALPVDEPPYARAVEALDALAGIELFQSLSPERCREFVTVAKREKYPPGALIIGQGEVGDRFYIVLGGEAAVVRDGGVVRTYRLGDFFGETALLTGSPRVADVRAKSELVLLTVDRPDFLAFLRGTDLADAFLRLSKNRELPSWDLMGENGLLRELSSPQRTQLQALLEADELKSGAPLVGASGWLLDSARVDYEETDRPATALGRAAFLCPYAWPDARFVVTTSGRAFRIPSGLATFLENNPRLLMAVSSSPFVL